MQTATVDNAANASTGSIQGTTRANITLYHTHPHNTHTSQLHILHFAMCECLDHKKPTNLRFTQQIQTCS